MSESTDYLGLNKLKVFKKLNETLKQNVKTVQNVLTVNDGILFTWDFQDNCVITLNLKDPRCFEENRVGHQILLPTSTSRFTVQRLRANPRNTLLIVAGGAGILVLELPERCPPHGAFGSNNKEIVYCKSYSLDEQLLTRKPGIEVRQVRFHPASEAKTHILVLTSDNAFRLYNIENSSASCLKVYSIGIRPLGPMPGTKTSTIDLLGGAGIDFDFGPPQLADDSSSLEEENNPFLYKKQDAIKQAKEKWNYLKWPIFVITSDGTIFVAYIDITLKQRAELRGSLKTIPEFERDYDNPFTSVLCLPSTPPVLCLATVNGTIFHGAILPIDKCEANTQIQPNEFATPPDCALFVFESLSLELGKPVSESMCDHWCAISLHPDESRLGHYFATHEAGIHSINVPAINAIQQFAKGKDDDYLMNLVISEPSTPDYLVCTKSGPLDSKDVNPIVGFGILYDPTTIIALLAKGPAVSSLAVSFSSLPSSNDFESEDVQNFNSPLRNMLSEPFDLQIQRILQQVTSQPILKLSGGGDRTPQESYEVLQRAAQVFREEYFKNHEKAREEIQKRVKVLQMLKKYQVKELDKFLNEKQALQEKAENLAEKYEDIKDKQDYLKSRCEHLLVLVSQKKSIPSEAEKKFLNDLKQTTRRMEKYETSIGKLKNQIKYQEIQMDNWKKELSKNETGLGSIQSNAIKTNLQNMTDQITQTIKEVKEYKKKLALI